MLPLNCPPFTLAQRLNPEAWRNIADCAYARHRLHSAAQDYDACSREWQSWELAIAQSKLAAEPLPIKVADGMHFYGKAPELDGLCIDRDWHLEQSINGETVSVPDYLDSAISDEETGWKDKVCDYLKAIDDKNRDFVWDRLEINGEHDLTEDVDAVSFTPSDRGDRFWSQDTYIACDGKLKRMDGSIGDSNFLDDRLGWHVADLQTGDYLAECENKTQRYSVGYSNNPTAELRGDSIGDPVWHYGLGCFVGRLKYWPRPVRLYPETPCYGG